MFDDLLGGLTGSSGGKDLSSATATTTISPVFGGSGGQVELTQLWPVILAGLAVVGVMVIAALAFRD